MQDADGDTQIQVEESSDEDKIRFDTGGTERMIIDSTGVGIGTSSPSEKLSILGGHVSVGDSTGANGTEFLLEGYREIYNAAKYGNTSIRTTYSTTTNASDMLFYTASGGTNTAEAMRIDSSGNVGIGAAPTNFSNYNNLDVRSKNTSGGAVIGIHDTDGVRVGAISHSEANPAFDIEAFNNNVMRFSTGSEAMRIDSSGLVGINWAGSTARLGIIQNGSSTAGLNITDGSSADFLVYAGYTSGVSRIGPGTGALAIQTAGTERIRIDTGGRVLIGHTAAVGGHSELFGIDTDASSSFGMFISGNSSGGTQTAVRFFDSGSSAGVVGAITFTTDSTAYATSSDARLKDVTGEARGLEVINELNPVAYNWKKSGKADEGLIAQEVLDLVPNAVHQSTDDEMYSMDYSKLVVHLVKAVQEQQTQIDALQSEINLLKGE